MAVFQDSLKKREVEVGLVFKSSLECLFLLAQIVAGTLINIDQNSRKADPLKVRAMFSIEAFAA